MLPVNRLPVLLRPTVSEDFIVAGSGFFSRHNE